MKKIFLCLCVLTFGAMVCVGAPPQKAAGRAVKFIGKVKLSDDVRIEMIEVTPGSFVMSRHDYENYSDEIEHKKVITAPFYIGKYEVTQEQYQIVMQYNPSFRKGPKRPVEQVSWHEAMEFCEKLNKFAPQGWRFTLPTEAQWEFAARGGAKQTDFKYSGSDYLDEVGWYWDNSMKTTHNVGRKKPNALGIYDMSGNVREWCLDNFETKSDNSRAEFNRNYKDSDFALRVSRGGSWRYYARDCRAADRYGWTPDYRGSSLGFRIVLVKSDEAPVK